jgi:hypothetical protein
MGNTTVIDVVVVVCMCVILAETDIAIDLEYVYGCCVYVQL